MTLTEAFLNRLIQQVDAPDVVAIALMGSYARGDATPHSDVDVWCFMAQPDASSYTLRLLEGRLISLTTTTIERKRADLRVPREAMWAVMGLRQMRILKDSDGALAQLQQEAFAFAWEPLQPEADRAASADLMGYAEEVHKVIGAWSRRDETVMLYGMLGLALGMPGIVAVQRGLLLATENSYFSAVGEAVGRDTAWTQALYAALGFGQPPPDITRRTAAGLALYRETAALLSPIIQPEHREVIDGTVQLIATLSDL